MTLPPRHFFGGLDRRCADDHAAALRALGASVYEFSTEAVYRNDKAALARQIAKIHVFAPIGTQHAGYAIQGGMIADPDGGEGTNRNLVLDILEVPTILYWDHVLTQAARYLIPSWPGCPQESVPDVVARLKHLLMHPLAVHFFPDSGHVAELERMGLATFDDDPVFVTAVSQLFVQHGAEAKGAPKRLLAQAAGMLCLGRLPTDHQEEGHQPGVRGHRRRDQLFQRRRVGNQDHFLGQETERRSIVRDMQEIIGRDHTAATLFARTVPAAIDRIRARQR